MNKIIITMICIIVVIGAVITAVVIYKPKDVETPQYNVAEVTNEVIEDDCTDEYQEMQNELLQTNSQEEKILPKASITFKKSYEKCGHTTSQYLEVPEELVNKTESELQEIYSDWNIEKFSDTEIVLNKAEDGECGEHYMVRDVGGKVVIYEILEDGTEKEYEETDISTEYLTDTDKLNMQKGIRVNGKQNLNQLIEDFE